MNENDFELIRSGFQLLDLHLRRTNELLEQIHEELRQQRMSTDENLEDIVSALQSVVAELRGIGK